MQIPWDSEFLQLKSQDSPEKAGISWSPWQHFFLLSGGSFLCLCLAHLKWFLSLCHHSPDTLERLGPWPTDGSWDVSCSHQERGKAEAGGYRVLGPLWPGHHPCPRNGPSAFQSPRSILSELSVKAKPAQNFGTHSDQGHMLRSPFVTGRLGVSPSRGSQVLVSRRASFV